VADRFGAKRAVERERRRAWRRSVTSAAIGAAMIGLVDDAIPGVLTRALESLDIACRDLDAAMLAMPNVHGDDVVASASLIALLLRVVTARRQVKQLELDVRAELGSHVRPATVS